MKVKAHKIERRFFDFEPESEFATRSETDEHGKRIIAGYAQVNNSESKKITEIINGTIRTFTEVIEPTAINENTDLSTVFHTVEHNFQRPVGRVGANTILKNTDKGLFFRTEIPADEHATDEQKNLFRNTQQRIIKGASFAFKVGSDRWEKRNGELYRSISQISKIVDVTSTINGAYDDAFTFVRSLNEDEIKEVEQPAIEAVQPAYDAKTIDIDFQFSLLKSKTF